MTIPNCVTVSRIFLAPVFVTLIVLCEKGSPYRDVILIVLWIVYALIEFSDLADGYLARRLNLESDLGKVLDPFADTVSRLSCFFAFTVTGTMPWWIFLIVFYRDFWVSFLRILTAKKGLLLGARLSGKMKAWVYAFANLAALASFTADRVLPFIPARDTLYLIRLLGFGGAAIVALWSGMDYSFSFFLENRRKIVK